MLSWAHFSGHCMNEWTKQTISTILRWSNQRPTMTTEFWNGRTQCQIDGSCQSLDSSRATQVNKLALSLMGTSSTAQIGCSLLYHVTSQSVSNPGFDFSTWFFQEVIGRSRVSNSCKSSAYRAVILNWRFLRPNCWADCVANSRVIASHGSNPVYWFTMKILDCWF